MEITYKLASRTLASYVRCALDPSFPLLRAIAVRGRPRPYGWYFAPTLTDMGHVIHALGPTSDYNYHLLLITRT